MNATEIFGRLHAALLLLDPSWGSWCRFADAVDQASQDMAHTSDLHRQARAIESRAAWNDECEELASWYANRAKIAMDLGRAISMTRYGMEHPAWDGEDLLSIVDRVEGAAQAFAALVRPRQPSSVA